MRRLSAGLWRLGWRLAALLLILTALYVALGRELVPMVAEYRLELEDKAREHGLALRIGQLQGGWEGLAPVLIARDLELGEGDERLHLDRLSITPDVLASLWQRAPRIAHLRLEGLQLHVREQADGRWRLDGLPQRENQPPLDIARLLEQSKLVERVSLSGGRLVVQPRDQDALALTYVELDLRNGSSKQSLQGRLVLPDGQPLALQAQARLSSDDWRASPASLYLSLPQSEWAAWLPKRLLGEWSVEALRGGGELWLDLSDGSLAQVSAKLRLPDVQAQRQRRAPLKLQNFSVDLFYERREQGFDMVLDSLAFSLGDVRWGTAHIGLQHRRGDAGDDSWLAKADRIDLAPLPGLVDALVELPPRAAEILHGLRPRGVVANLQAHVRPAAPLAERLQLVASLDRIGVDAYLGSPALENVSGRIEGGIAAGELRVDSENFALHLDNLFPEAWHYRRARATLHWQYDEEAFSLSSPYLSVLGDEGPIAGDFMIRLIRDPAEEDYMDLRVGLRDGDAAYTAKYLPTRAPAMSAPLAQWLTQAIRGGKVEEGWFQYQGSLNKGSSPASRSMSLFFKVSDAELAFQPGWPALRGARGDVFIEDDGVRVIASEGALLDARVSDVRVDIPRVAGKPPRLSLQGQVSGSLQDTLRILSEAPTPAAPVFKGWQGEGALEGALQLDIPLSKDGAPAHVVADFVTRDAQLKLAEPALALEHVSGNFRYDTRTGLSAPDIRARAFGAPVRGKAQALGKGGVAHTRIEARGSIAYRRLANWLGMTQPLPLEGTLPYQLVLDLDGADSQLKIDSTLEGLAINLPAPFAKPAAEARPSDLRMTLQGAERRYWSRYGEVASLVFAGPAGRVEDGRGELRLGGVARLPTTQGLRVAGALERLDWNEWKQVLDGGVKVEERQARRLFAGGALQIGRFEGFGTTLDMLAVTLQRADDGWALDLESALLKGRVGLPDGARRPIDISLDYLKLPQPEKSPDTVPTERSDALASVDPRSLPALDVRIDKLWLGERPVGGWSFGLRPDDQGAAIQNLSLGLRGALLTGNAHWASAEGSPRTRYQGRIEGSNLGDVLLAWDFAPSLSSRRFRLDIEGSWPGSPAAVSLKGFSGVMGGNMENGQIREVQGGASALRVFGLLNFESIGRRLRLDFSDMLGKGLSYDRFKGILHASDGVYRTDRPLTMQGPSSNLELEGSIDMHAERIDAKMLVTLPVSNNLPLAALLVGAPAVGGALFIADKLLGDEVARFASVQYDVRGPLSDPKITFDKPFEKPQ